MTHTTPEREAALARAEAACRPCGPCDAGLPMGCQCDPEPRAVIAELLGIIESDAEVAARLAERDHTLTNIRNLADQWEADAIGACHGRRHNGCPDCIGDTYAAALRVVLDGPAPTHEAACTCPNRLKPAPKPCPIHDQSTPADRERPCRGCGNPRCPWQDDHPQAPTQATEEEA